MTIRTILLSAALAACGGKSHPAATASKNACPDAVTAAVTKAYPDAKQSPCEAEHEDGKDVFEIKIAKADGSKAEVELTADGTITGIEEVVPSMPDAVQKAFAAKYPGATAMRIEKVTIPGKPAMYELKLEGKEATFTETGDFVEEEGGGEADEEDEKD
jgi:hypothetical protein